MTPAMTYRVVGVRGDGSKRVLCDKLSSSEMAQHIAGNLVDGSPFASISVERDDVPLADSERDGELRFQQ